MKKNSSVLALLAFSAACALVGRPAGPVISGQYLEIRSCDVYTGACVANSEMGTAGREAMLVWNVRQGEWNGSRLDGLTVIAIVQNNETLGDVRYQSCSGKAVLILDERATKAQRDALVDFARTKAGSLVQEVVCTKAAPMQVAAGKCMTGSCATVKAGDLVEIATRCLGGKDHLCGNEENYYPPLTPVQGAFSAFTELAAFRGTGLNTTWEIAGKRSAYLGTF